MLRRWARGSSCWGCASARGLAGVGRALAPVRNAIGWVHGNSPPPLRVVQAVGEGMKLLGLCVSAGELVSRGHLYRAHQALIRIRTEHFREWDVSAEKARCAAKASAGHHSCAHGGRP